MGTKKGNGQRDIVVMHIGSGTRVRDGGNKEDIHQPLILIVATEVATPKTTPPLSLHPPVLLTIQVNALTSFLQLIKGEVRT